MNGLRLAACLMLVYTVDQTTNTHRNTQQCPCSSYIHEA
jgi:hypothetical protein